MNLFEQQNLLKHASDEQLIDEMKNPSGNAPQFLVLSELTRRNRAKQEFQRATEKQGTVVDRTIAERQGIRSVNAPGMPTRENAGGMSPQTPSNPQNVMNVAGPQNVQPTDLPPRSMPARGMVHGGLVHDEWDERTRPEGGGGGWGTPQYKHPVPEHSIVSDIKGGIASAKDWMFGDHGIGSADDPLIGNLSRSDFFKKQGTEEDPAVRFRKWLFGGDDATPSVAAIPVSPGKEIADRIPATPESRKGDLMMPDKAEEPDPMAEDIAARKAFYESMQGRLDKMDSRAEAQRKQAMGLALAKMGFTMAASKRGDFAAAAGEGGMAAIDSLQGSKDDYEKTMAGILGGNIELEKTRETSRRNDQWFKAQMLTADRLKRKPLEDIHYDLLKDRLKEQTPDRKWVVEKMTELMGQKGDGTGADEDVLNLLEAGKRGEAAALAQEKALDLWNRGGGSGGMVHSLGSY